MASAQGNQSREKTDQASIQRTDFPSQFLQQYQNVFGPGFGVNELIAALPRTQGLFGGSAGLQAAQPYNPMASPAPGAAPSASQAYVPPGAAPYAPTQGQGVTTGPRRYTAAELGNYALGPDEQRRLAGTLDQLAKHNPSGSYTLAELQTAGRDVLNTDATMRYLQPVLGRLAAEEQLAAQMPQAPRFGAPAPTVGVNNALPGGIAGATSALGFGTKGPQAQVQPIRDIPTINAAQVNMQGIPDYERAVFESQFRPVERELSRQGGLADQRLSAELAQRGLGGSGTGIGQMMKQRREVSQQIQFAAEDASNRASVQRFQTEYNQRLENAGFDMQAQTDNAHNVLLGDTARAENYLKTIGLNADTAAKEKTSFLDLLGLQAQDLNRMDQFQLGVVDRLMNTWLQTASVLAGAGQISQGASAGKQKSNSGGLGIVSGSS